MFDAEAFKQTSVEGEMSTSSNPIPVGEVQAVIKTTDFRQTDSGYTIMDVIWEIDDAQVAEETGRDINTCRQSIFLDVNESGGLDMGKGKNVQLGRLRAAVGQNGAGPWSPVMLEGQVAKIRVDHRIYEGNTYAEVKGVTAL